MSELIEQLRSIRRSLHVEATDEHGIGAEVCQARAGVIDQAAAELARLTAENAEKDAEIERLRGIVAKLPKTADGVPVVPGRDKVWGFDEEKVVGVLLAQDEYHEDEDDWLSYYFDMYASELYSTREAAEAAREGGE